jgi:hypothetical protein
VHEREVASKMRPNGLRSTAERTMGEGEAAAAMAAARSTAAAPSGELVIEPSPAAKQLVQEHEQSHAPVSETERAAAPVDPDLLSLEQGYPRFAEQWDYELNAGRKGLHPQETPVKKLRKTKVAWACSEAPDHRWSATLQQRLRNASCPFCADKKVSTTNSLATVHPEIAAEFHPTLNRRDATLPDGHGKVRLQTWHISSPPAKLD